MPHDRSYGAQSLAALILLFIKKHITRREQAWGQGPGLSRSAVACLYIIDNVLETAICSFQVLLAGLHVYQRGCPVDTH